MFILVDENDYFKEERLVEHNVILKLRDWISMDDVKCYCLSVTNTSGHESTHNSFKTNDEQNLKEESSLIDENIHLAEEENSHELESARMNNLIESILFKRRTPKLLMATKVAGILGVLLCLCVSAYNIVHFSTQIAQVKEYS